MRHRPARGGRGAPGPQAVPDTGPPDRRPGRVARGRFRGRQQGRRPMARLRRRFLPLLPFGARGTSVSRHGSPGNRSTAATPNASASTASGPPTPSRRSSATIAEPSSPSPAPATSRRGASPWNSGPNGPAIRRKRRRISLTRRSSSPRWAPWSHKPFERSRGAVWSSAPGYVPGPGSPVRVPVVTFRLGNPAQADDPTWSWWPGRPGL